MQPVLPGHVSSSPHRAYLYECSTIIHASDPAVALAPRSAPGASWLPTPGFPTWCQPCPEDLKSNLTPQSPFTQDYSWLYQTLFSVPTTLRVASSLVCHFTVTKAFLNICLWVLLSYSSPCHCPRAPWPAVLWALPTDACFNLALTATSGCRPTSQNCGPSSNAPVSWVLFPGLCPC